METRGKNAFFRSVFLGISSVFSLTYLVFFHKKYSTCDTCDSKKVKTPVDARVRTRAREDIIGIFTIQFFVFPFELFRVVHPPSIAF